MLEIVAEWRYMVGCLKPDSRAERFTPAGALNYGRGLLDPMLGSPLRQASGSGKCRLVAQAASRSWCALCWPR
jgi:hypothetical protein